LPLLDLRRWRSDVEVEVEVEVSGLEYVWRGERGGEAMPRRGGRERASLAVCEVKGERWRWTRGFVDSTGEKREVGERGGWVCIV